tara:strand:- start:1458 stop:2210 length:753 start_codon:yes stop_codon:yes gene_type:complete
MKKRFNSDRLILDVCGGTGSWSKPYRDAGYTVIVLDPEAFTDNAGGAVCGGEGDVRDPRYHVKGCFGMPVHGILMSPPCTEFASSGARWWADKAANSPHLLEDAIAVAEACLNLVKVHEPKWWVLENPVGRFRRLLADKLTEVSLDVAEAWDHAEGRNEYQPFFVPLRANKPVMTFHPCEFAGWLVNSIKEAYTKATQLFGRFRKPLKRPLDPVHGSKMHKKYGGKSARTKRMRSKTPEGFAEAFYHANP